MKSRSDRANILGARVENPSSMKFVITIHTPKRLYGAGLNVWDFVNSFVPFVDVQTDTGDVGEDKFTKYTLTV
ncbi:hypothetical protein EBR66_08130 [bacterium]|nr:hypothetical protein [bacterium]